MILDSIIYGDRTRTAVAFGLARAAGWLSATFEDMTKMRNGEVVGTSLRTPHP